MANDSNRAGWYMAPEDDRDDMSEDRMRGGTGDEVRGIADDDEEFDDDEDMDEEEDEGAI